MTPEERFQQIERNLQSASERVDMLNQLHRDADREHSERAAEQEKRTAEHEKNIAELRGFTRQMTVYAADVKDSIRRLTNIAEAHGIQLDEHDKRLDDLEDNK
jgi:hypothetical protein